MKIFTGVLLLLATTVALSSAYGFKYSKNPYSGECRLQLNLPGLGEKDAYPGVMNTRYGSNDQNDGKYHHHVSSLGQVGHHGAGSGHYGAASSHHGAASHHGGASIHHGSTSSLHGGANSPYQSGNNRYDGSSTGSHGAGTSNSNRFASASSSQTGNYGSGAGRFPTHSGSGLSQSNYGGSSSENYGSSKYESGNNYGGSNSGSYGSTSGNYGTGGSGSNYGSSNNNYETSSNNNYASSGGNRGSGTYGGDRDRDVVGSGSSGNYGSSNNYESSSNSNYGSGGNRDTGSYGGVRDRDRNTGNYGSSNYDRDTGSYESSNYGSSSNNKYGSSGNRESSALDNYRPSENREQTRYTPAGQGSGGSYGSSSSENYGQHGGNGNQQGASDYDDYLDKAASVGYDREFANEVLSTHNSYRAIHSTPPVSLDEKMSNTAQDWASQLAAGLTYGHSPDAVEGAFGESIKVLSVPTTTGTNLVERLYEERINYDYRNPLVIKSPPSRANSHFTALVWKGTRRIGVGKAIANDGRTFVVINYWPAGNNVDVLEDNVLPARKDLGPTKQIFF